MKFNEKLVLQRKKNNLSQEQLAEKLEISRQAVSKWESATSHPDMEKMIKLCKILNCTLEDLLDDGTINNQNSNINTKINISIYIQSFLNFITKIVNMFLVMRTKERLKCIFEMICYIFLLLIISSSIYISIFNLLSIFSEIIFIIEVLKRLCLIFLSISSIIVYIHLFKIRYLDYYITIEDQNVTKTNIEKPIEMVENTQTTNKNKKEKVIIRDPKHASISFINLLWKMVIGLAKIINSFFLLGLSCLLVFYTISIAFLSYHIQYDIIFLWVSIVIFGLFVINLLIMSYSYNFIFNKPILIKKPFYILIISLITIGISSGLTLVKFTSYNIIHKHHDLERISNIQYVKTEEIDKIYINYYNYNNFTFEIDNNLNQLKIEIINIKDFETGNIRIFNDKEARTLDIYQYSNIMNFMDYYPIMINNLKKGDIRIFDGSEIEIKITLSQKDFDKIETLPIILYDLYEY